MAKSEITSNKSNQLNPIVNFLPNHEIFSIVSQP